MKYIHVYTILTNNTTSNWNINQRLQLHVIMLLYSSTTQDVHLNVSSLNNEQTRTLIVFLKQITIGFLIDKHNWMASFWWLLCNRTCRRCSISTLTFHYIIAFYLYFISINYLRHTISTLTFLIDALQWNTASKW